jgi:integrase
MYIEKNEKENPPLATPSSSTPYKRWVYIFREALNHKRVPKECQNNSEFHFSDLKLVDYGGDIVKPWYIDFTIYNGEEQTRHRVKANINRLKKPADRYAAAKLLMNELKLCLSLGSLSFLEKGKKRTEVKVKSISAVNHLREMLRNKEGTVRAITLTAYNTAIHHFENHYGDKDLFDIDEAAADSFIRYLRLLKNGKGETYADKTIHSIIGNVRNLINEGKLLNPNPFSGKKLSNQTTGELNIPWLTEEFDRLRKYTEDKVNLRAYWGMIYFCAIRPTEISYLQKSNIDLNANHIRIHSKHSKVKRTHLVAIPKLFKPTLVEYLDQVTNKDYLFTHNLMPGAKNVRGNRLSHYWKTLVKDTTGIDKNVYQLKHTSAIKMLKSGLSIYDISKHFRHSEVSMTEQYLKSLEGYASAVMVEGFPDF